MVSSLGSGVVVSKEGLTLTASHIAGSPGRKLIARFPDGTQLPAVALGSYRPQDAGMVQIQARETAFTDR